MATKGTDLRGLLGRPPEVDSGHNAPLGEVEPEPASFVTVGTPWEAGGGGYVQRMEQYLVIVVDDEEARLLRVSLLFKHTDGLRSGSFDCRYGSSTPCGVYDLQSMWSS